MKKIILVQVIFFILLFCIREIFYYQDEIKEILRIILLSGLSFVFCRYILKSEKMFCTSFKIALSLFILFEISTLIERFLGFLPRYTDVPIIISASLAFVGAFVYMFTLYLLCLLWKKVKSINLRNHS